MRPEQVRRLKVGARVRWTVPDDTALGTVTRHALACGVWCVEVAWDDGPVMLIDPAEAHNLERLTTTAAPR